MSRAPILDESNAPAAAKPFYAKGNPGPIAGTLANVPDLMQVALPFIMRSLGPSTIGMRTKEIVILRASALQKCRYCTQTHSVIALDAGLTTDEVKALRGEGDVRQTFGSAAALALIAWTDVVAVGPGNVEESTYGRLREHFSPAEIVELTMTIGTTLLLNRYATALDLPTTEAHLLRLSQAGLST
jgi:AhpD family alkylhydroperoxidase